MAEADNFEEDLFADLYEDDAPAKEEPPPQLKIEAAPPVDIKTEVKTEDAQQNGDGDQQMYGGGDVEDDDEIDFNLGGNENSNSGGYDAPAPQHHEYSGPGIKEDG